MDQFEVQVEISRLSGTTRMQESLQATVALRDPANCKSCAERLL